VNASDLTKIFLFSTVSTPDLGPTQPPIQWVPEVKRPEREGDHSPLPRIRRSTHPPPSPIHHGIVLSINWVMFKLQNLWTMCIMQIFPCRVLHSKQQPETIKSETA
jgi:hypothetical protein